MRLIDADKLMEDMQKTITEQSGTIDWLNLIHRQPTAYDANKVAEQLEEARNTVIDDFLEKAMKQFTDFDLKHGYPTVTDCKVILRDIVEQLKGGGVDAGSI